MMKRLLVSLSIALAITACSSKEKKEDTSATPAEAASEDSVTSKEMSFDPTGSDSGKIDGLKSINFDYDKATLTSESRRILGSNADWIKSHAKTSLQIEGHCDDRGSIEYNLSLGERRAKAVKDYMVKLGIEGQRMTIISYGKEKPLVQGDSEQAYARNRRANFVPLAQ